MAPRVAFKGPTQHSTPIEKSNKKALAIQNPPGYVVAKTSTKGSAPVKPMSPEQLTEMRQAKAWEVAYGPGKNIPMQGFMMYMTGGGIQVFSVMSVYFLLKNVFDGVFGVNKAFSSLETPADKSSNAFLQQKAMFVICQLGLLLVGLWKCNQMGLFPIYSSDWLAFKAIPEEFLVNTLVTFQGTPLRS